MKTYQAVIVALGAFLMFACGTPVKTSTPTEAVQTYIKASGEKDVEAMKKTLSKRTLEAFETTAQEYGITLDELLRQREGALFKENAATRNERIEGDAATVEVENNMGGSETIPFVKEDGAWKIAFDKRLPPAPKK